jgi:hypothetical protein
LQPTRSNSLTGIFDPAVFSPMTQLTYLNLGYNSLSGVLPTEIGDMVSLTNLDLMSNAFTAINFTFEKLVVNTKIRLRINKKELIIFLF